MGSLLPDVVLFVATWLVIYLDCQIRHRLERDLKW